MIIIKISGNMRKKVSWIFCGNLLYALSQWGIVVIMAKLGNVEMIGQFSLALAITAPIILFFNIQLRSIIATDSTNQYEFRQYLGNRIILLIIALFVILLFAFLGPYNSMLSIIIFLVGLSKAVESLSELTHGYFQKNESMDYIGKSQILKAIFSLVTVSIVLYFYESLLLAIVGLILIWGFRLFSYDFRKVKESTSIKPTLDVSIKDLFILGLPLGIVSILNSLNTNIPRYFIEYYIGLEELGYFSALVYILVAGTLFIKPISLVAAPRLARAYNSKNINTFLKVNYILMLVALILGGSAMAISYFGGEIILTLVYGREYAEYHDLFFLIMVGSGLSYCTTFLNISLVAARSFKIQPYINFVTTIVGVILAFLLIPNYHLLGAGYVVIGIFLTQLIGSLLLFIKVIMRLRTGE